MKLKNSNNVVKNASI